MLRRARTRIVIAFLVLGELTGHLWVYPRGVAMGWDSSLAYLPYFSLRQQSLDWLAAHNIPENQVGTAFPNESCYRYTNLKNEGPCFSNYDFNKNTFIVYSNVCNDFNKGDIAELYNHWDPVFSSHSGAIDMVIFKKK